MKLISKLNDLSISVRLNILMGGFVTIMITGLAAYSYKSHAERIERSETLMANYKIKTLSSIVEFEVNNNKQHLERSIDVAWQLIEDGGNIKENQATELTWQVTDQIENTTTNVVLKEWMFNKSILQNNNLLVDNIKRLTNVSSTLFQKTEIGFVRIATTLTKSDGTRVIGTYINNSSPVIQQINSGQRFVGRALVVGQWYRTIYDPIVINGVVRGMLYIGVPEKDLSSLQGLINDFGSDGSSPFVLDHQGNVILSGAQMDVSSWVGVIKDEITKGKESLRNVIDNGEWLFYKQLPDLGLNIAIFSNVKKIEEEKRSQLITVIVAVLIALPTFLLLLTLLNSGIIKGLRKATLFAREVENGNLTGAMNFDRKDELGQLGQSLDNMVFQLRDIVSGVTENAAAVVMLGNQLNTASMQMSDGANVQASSAEEVSSSMQEMTANIMQNSENAQSTGRSVDQMVTAIDETAILSVEAANIMQDVSRKVSAIRDIARQTNILALNAAVEAARAGESGRGFAVVAAEVRKLAERSRIDTESISESIARGVEITRRAGDQLALALPRLRESNEKVQDIVASSREQALGADQVNTALVELNRITQQSAAISEEVASETLDMNRIAGELKQTIGFFNI